MTRIHGESPNMTVSVKNVPREVWKDLSVFAVRRDLTLGQALAEIIPRGLRAFVENAHTEKQNEDGELHGDA